MKQCSNCRRILPLEYFSPKSTLHRKTYCKECQRAYCREHYRRNVAAHIQRRMIKSKRYRDRNRRLVVEYLLGHPCVDCGESDILVLDFDHRDGREKQFDISVFVSRGQSWRRIEAEIAKCDVRCANCHLRKTAIDLRWYKSLGFGT